MIVKSFNDGIKLPYITRTITFIYAIFAAIVHPTVIFVAESLLIANDIEVDRKAARVQIRAFRSDVFCAGLINW